MKISASILMFYIICFAVLQRAYAQERSIEKLNNSINSYLYDEISPVITLDGQTLYFTRVGAPNNSGELYYKGENCSRSVNPYRYKSQIASIFSVLEGKPVTNPRESTFNQDVWVANTVDGLFDEIQHPPYPLNSALPNSVCSRTPDDSVFVVINQFEKEGGMKGGFSTIVKREEGAWSFPDPLNIMSFNSRGPDVNLCMSKDGGVIIISMDGMDSYGGNDLYISFKINEQVWSPPANIGGQINSAFKEIAPFISSDNKTLYFASNRLGSLGGTDIYFSKRLDETWKHWSAPVRMTAPINSRADDSQPFFDEVSGYLYFCSKREGTSDIYRSSIAPPIPNTIVVRGSVINSKTEELTSAEVFLQSINKPKEKYIQNSVNGKFLFSVPKGKTYEIWTEKEGYINHKKVLDLRSKDSVAASIFKTLYVDPLEVEAKISINPIYFVQSKAVVKEGSKAELDRIAQILACNKEVSIKIGGHTDNLGDQQSLLTLSKNRARAVKKYLVQKGGIAPYRIETAGYGAQFPVTKKEDEYSRSLNRRVEFRITKVQKVSQE